MTEYVCFSCNKQLNEVQIKKRVRCPYCGSKIVFKRRVVSTKVDAV
ncbi:MAG: DNA-directed RNA polymerase subunit P [Candidatus Nanoarchaeia archaeon]